MEQRRGSPEFALPLIVLVICCAFPEGGEENVYVCETIPLEVLDCAMQGAVHLTRRTGCVCVSSVSHTALSSSECLRVSYNHNTSRMTSC